ncbi:MAG: aminopeptidase [Anaerolineae bacterium]
MAWPERDEIEEQVLNLLRINMGFREGESLFVCTNPPAPQAWNEWPHILVRRFAETSALAKLMAEIAQDQFRSSRVTFIAYPGPHQSAQEPPEDVAHAILEHDIVLALPNDSSLSHTDARRRATEKGVRFASMNNFPVAGFSPDGAMAVDYAEVSDRSQAVAQALTEAEDVLLTSPTGTELRFSLAGREAYPDTGYLAEPGAFGNLPGGEAFIAPVEGTGVGMLVAPHNWQPTILQTEDLSIEFEAGRVVRAERGGERGRILRERLGFEPQAPVHEGRRNLAELGIGTNPNAQARHNIVEAEKTLGTVHIAIGDNSGFGGTVQTDLHNDFVVPEPTLLLDGGPALEAGRLLV